MPTEPLATTRTRAEPADGPAALMRVSADLYGSEALARDLDVASRSLYRWIDGTHPVPAGILKRTRQLLIERRQRMGMLIQVIREQEARA